MNETPKSKKIVKLEEELKQLVIDFINQEQTFTNVLFAKPDQDNIARINFSYIFPEDNKPQSVSIQYIYTPSMDGPDHNNIQIVNYKIRNHES